MNSYARATRDVTRNLAAFGARTDPLPLTGKRQIFSPNPTKFAGDFQYSKTRRPSSASWDQEQSCHLSPAARKTQKSMAKIAYSAIVNDISGKMGTDVFSKGRSGPTSRIRVHGKNSQTPAQRAVRANLSKAATTYKNFTGTQAAAWRAYGQSITKTNPISGKTYHPAGGNIFAALTTKLLQVNSNATIPTSPPVSSFVGDTISVAVTASTGKLTFTASGANATKVTTELLIQPLPSLNRLPSSNNYRTATFFTFVAGTLSKDVTVPAGYYAAGYRFVNTQTGQSTDMIPLTIQLVGLSVTSSNFNEKKKAA